MNQTEFNAQPLLETVDDWIAEKAEQFGRRVQDRARENLSEPSRPKRYEELTSWERQRYDAARLAARIAGRPAPAIWFRTHSEPGQSPLTRRGNLARRIAYAYDPVRQTLIVGPTALPGRSPLVPRVLEEGGQLGAARIAARPYMRPAFNDTVRDLPAILRR